LVVGKNLNPAFLEFGFYPEAGMGISFENGISNYL